MRVRMTASISGTRNGADWPKRGAEIDLPDSEAAALCAQRLATPVTTPEPSETATVEQDVEQRPDAMTRKRTRRRSSASGSEPGRGDTESG